MLLRQTTTLSKQPMPPKALSTPKSRSAAKKLMRKAENAALQEKLGVLQRALFTEDRKERWVLARSTPPVIFQMLV